MARKPRLGVHKFASCDGCQLMVLDCEDQLLAIADSVDIAYFPEATTAEIAGGYDVSLVEGSVTTREDARRIHAVRQQSRVLVSIGACATSGGIQALRNAADVREFAAFVYPHPEWIEALDRSTPIRNLVYVDYELRGCPISKRDLLELLSALLAGRKPNTPTYSVCEECKRRGAGCVLVSRRLPCMGPVTQAGCGAICPSFGRGCYGCFGPSDSANTESMTAVFERLGVERAEARRLFRGIDCAAEAFRAAAEALER